MNDTSQSVASEEMHTKVMLLTLAIPVLVHFPLTSAAVMELLPSSCNILMRKVEKVQRDSPVSNSPST